MPSTLNLSERCHRAGSVPELQLGVPLVANFLTFIERPFKAAVEPPFDFISSPMSLQIYFTSSMAKYAL